MISRIIDARADDMRAFVEEAAGISRYKERRKETEVRVAETRENLERLQDVRDEVEKQIRHLQRQAAGARRYQALKEQERRLTAQLLALRLRELDSGAEVHDATVRARDLTLQGELAALRAAESAIERQRAVQSAHSDSLAAVQARCYEVGADISRLEQSIEHTRELRERQRADLAQTHTTLAELDAHIGRDERQLATLRAELARLAPERVAAQQAESVAAARLETLEQGLQRWQQRWDEHTGSASAADQSVQVERARIEQLDNQLQRLAAQAQRLAEEGASLGAADSAGELTRLTAAESAAGACSAECTVAHAAAQERVQALRAAQLRAEDALEQARGARAAAGAELASLEGLQAAALAARGGEAAQWLERSGLTARPRVAATLEVEAGWERAVETALGDYLEAVCVSAARGARTAAGAARRRQRDAGGVRRRDRLAPARTLASRARGPAAVLAPLAQVLTARVARGGAAHAQPPRRGTVGDHPGRRMARSRLAARQPRTRGARRGAGARAAPEGAAGHRGRQQRARDAGGGHAEQRPGAAGAGGERARRRTGRAAEGASAARGSARRAAGEPRARGGLDAAGRAAAAARRGAGARAGNHRSCPHPRGRGAGARLGRSAPNWPRRRRR